MQKRIFGPVTGAVLLFLLLLGCTGKTGQDRRDQPALTVATASNVQYAMTELAREFERQTGVRVELILSSSGKLAAQISQGAPYDLFVSADEKYPASLNERGFAAAPPRIYAYGALVLWSVKSGYDLSGGLAALPTQGTGKIAVANPALAPYGEQSIRVLEQEGLLEQLRPRLVYGENISQTNQYILSGACEVGFTAKSIVLAPDLPQKGTWVEIPPEKYSPIAQAAMITRHGQKARPEESGRFFEFLFSGAAQEILRRYGYQLPVQ